MPNSTKGTSDEIDRLKADTQVRKFMAKYRYQYHKEMLNDLTNLIAQEVNKARIDELEQFRANTGQYEMERDYNTPSGQRNWNVDIRTRNKLKQRLDHILQDRIKQLTNREDI